jgi:outer membrane protein, heavy metal efflux system
MTVEVILTLALAQPLAFDEALARADETPRLVGLQLAVERQAALAAQVPFVIANPAVFVQPGVRRLATGTTGPEAYVGVTQEVSVSGAGTSRAASAKAETEAASLDRTVQRRRLRLEVAQGWLALWAVQALLEAAQEESRLAKEWAAKVERGANAGGFTRVDLAVAKAWQAEAVLTALSLEGEVFSRGVALNRLLALSKLEPARTTKDLPPLQPTVERPLVSSDVSKTPPVRAAIADAEAHRRRSFELLAGKGTSLQVGAMGWREGTGDLAAVATLQVTLPLFERAQRERAVAEAALTRAEALTDTIAAEELADRVDAHHELEHTAEVLAVIEQQLLPATLEAATGLQRRFDAGEANALELVLSRRTLVATRARRVSAQADVVLAQFRWSELSREAP